MKFTLSLSLNNSAFSDQNNGAEVARILRKIANNIEESNLQDGDKDNLRDVNGNLVGYVEVKPRDILTLTFGKNSIWKILKIVNWSKIGVI